MSVLPATEEPQDSTAITYYDRPLLKPPVWVWTVPTYFFVGGVAGAAMVVGMAAQVVEGPKLRAFDERCRWIGAIGGAAGSALLISDLGRRWRFLNMLRVFRPHSPMSIGSWVLAVATPLSAGSALLTFSHEGPLWYAGFYAGIAAGVLGLPLSTYTAVLLGNTAVPLWQTTRRTMPLLFGASSASSLAAVFELMSLDQRETRIADRFAIISRVADLTAGHFFERDANRIPRVGRPLREGASGAMWTAGQLLTAASLVLTLIPGSSKLRRRTAGVLGIAGGLALRFAVFHAGKASSLDPRATFEMQSPSRTGLPACPGT